MRRPAVGSATRITERTPPNLFRKVALLGKRAEKPGRPSRFHENNGRLLAPSNRYEQSVGLCKASVLEAHTLDISPLELLIPVRLKPIEDNDANSCFVEVDRKKFAERSGLPL